jgi:hypothetical protein
MANTILPKDIETHLDNNILFNKFGIVNIRAVKASFKCEIPDKTLKKLINNRFAKEMVGEKIEFI